MNRAREGAQALERKDFAGAIESYSAAIAQNPDAGDYFIKRSAAYARCSPPNHTRALQDAERAVQLANARGKREMLAQAQLRRGIAFFGLEHWHSAQQCFDWVRKLDDKEKSLGIWTAKLSGKIMVSNQPIEEIPSQRPPSPTAEPIPVRTTAAIRHEWYQHDDSVVVTIFIKGALKEQTRVDVHTSSLEVTIPLKDGASFQLSLDPLGGQVEPENSSFNVFSTKVEVVLQKKIHGLKWTALEGDEASAVPKDTAPLYPTSSKSGSKNWDKLSTDLVQQARRETGNIAQKDKLDDEFDEESDAVNGFFKKLYSGADPDTRRAMMKSYQESNGTALSTNWSEVGKAKVKTQPPDGMEARPW